VANEDRNGTWGNPVEMPDIREMQRTQELRRVERAEEEIRELMGRKNAVQQELTGVEEYDDSAILGKLKALGVTASSIEGRLFLIEQEISKIKRWWREWPISFRVVFASGDPFKSASAQIRVNAGAISLSGVMHYVETTLLDMYGDAEADPPVPAILHTGSQRTVLYYKLASDGTDGWTPGTGEFVGVALNETYPYILPESTVLHSSDTLTQVEYWFPLAIFDQGWNAGVGDGIWQVTQAKIGVLTVEAILADKARFRPGQTASGTATNKVFFAGGQFVAQATTALPAKAITVSASCVLYLEVTPDGATDYTFTWQQTAGIDTYPTDAEGYARIPLARVLVANSVVQEVFQLRRGGPIPLQGKVP
jgi:hypothetical protein